MIEAVIFDLDGTLINLPIDYEKLLLEFGKIIKTSDMQPLTKTIARLDEENRKEIFGIWDKAEDEAWKSGTLKEEGMTLYRKFDRKPKALVTMQGKSLVQKIVKALKLSFSRVVTREDSLDRLEQLKIAAKDLGVDLQNVLFIGNTEGDVDAARDLGCQFLRVEE